MSLYTVIALIVCCGTYVTLSCDPNDVVGCPRNFAPVCATFYKTFDNECSMKNELCKLAQDGFHFTQQDVGDCCHTGTPLIYWPTCASDGKTYNNWWEMMNEACAQKTYLTEAPPTSCEDFPPDWLPMSTLPPVSK